MIDYFVKGFHLTNSAYKLVLFSFGFFTAMYISMILTDSSWSIFAGVFAIIFFILGLCEMLIAPLILKEQQKTDLPFAKIFDIFKSNLPRTIKGAVVFASCMFLFMIVMFGLSTFTLLSLGSEQITENTVVFGSIIFIILIIISSLSIFTPLFYALEKQSLTSSIIHSIKYSLKHLPFFALLLLLSITSSLPTLIPENENIYISYPIDLLSNLLTAYIGTWVITTALIYYQKNS